MMEGEMQRVRVALGTRVEVALLALVVVLLVIAAGNV